LLFLGIGEGASTVPNPSPSQGKDKLRCHMAADSASAVTNWVWLEAAASCTLCLAICFHALPAVSPRPAPPANPPDAPDAPPAPDAPLEISTCTLSFVLASDETAPKRECHCSRTCCKSWNLWLWVYSPCLQLCCSTKLTAPRLRGW
jgi:hypothetical protein